MKAIQPDTTPQTPGYDNDTDVVAVRMGDDGSPTRLHEKPRQLLILRHSPMDGPGHLTDYFRRCGWETQLFDAPHLDFDAIDPLESHLVVLLGSGLSIYDRNLFPFIDRELAFLQRRLQADRPTLGICFGAQLIATALGSEVFRAPEPEIGWFPIELTPSGRDSPLRHLGTQLLPAVMHWHQDTFVLPPGTRRLARSDRCDVQAFDRGRRILALQFHPEVTARGVEDWLAESSFPAESRTATIEAIREGAVRFQPAMQAQMQHCLDDWLTGLDA